MTGDRLWFRGELETVSGIWPGETEIKKSADIFSTSRHPGDLEQTILLLEISGIHCSLTERTSKQELQPSFNMR